MENYKEIKKEIWIRLSFVMILLSVAGSLHAYSICSVKSTVNRLTRHNSINSLGTSSVDTASTIKDSLKLHKNGIPSVMRSYKPKIDLPADPGHLIDPDGSNVPDPIDPNRPRPIVPHVPDPIPPAPIIQGPIDPDLPDRPIYRDEIVGTPNGNLTISNAGAVCYDLKIDVPNGGSLTPQLSLSYNSQNSGYGLVGYGINLAGFSVITRGTKDLFHDGLVKGITYTNSDTYFLDGKRLILQSGTAGDEGAVYTVEGNPFTKVIIHGDYNNSTANTWFEVKTSTGIVYKYGNSETSKLCYKNKNGYARIASWYICQMEDKYTNYITYEYESSGLNIRPISVTYGMNGEKSRGITNKISFSYQSLGANARTYMVEDQQSKIDVCLSNITTSCNNSTYRLYNLIYNQTSDGSLGKYTRLVKVEEKNGNGTSLAPIQLNWNFLPSLQVTSSQLNVSGKDDRSYIKEEGKCFSAADLTGDGVSDIVRFAPVTITDYSGNGTTYYHNETYVYINRSKVASSGSISYEDPIIFRLPPVFSMGDLTSAIGGAPVMDFDGDGYNDLIIPYHNKADGHWNEEDFYLIRGCDIAAGETGTVKVFSIQLQATDESPLFATLDTEGNGKDNILCVEQRQKDGYYPCNILKYGNGTKPDKTEFKVTLPKDPVKIFTGDFNNDGLVDLILLYDGGYKIYFNDGGPTTATKFSESNTKAGSDFGNYWRVKQGDFDGDGLVDFVYNNSRETCLWIAHNNGDGTFSYTQSNDIGVADHASNKDDERFSIMVSDLDHDGRSDVVVCKAGYRHRGFPRFRNDYTNTQVRLLYSDGSNLILKNSYTKDREDDALESSIFLGDFDGDGHIELANYGSVLNNPNSNFEEKINVYKAGSDLSQSGKINNIIDGLGNSEQIEYAYLTNPLIYKQTIPNKYPVNTYTFPLSVVAKVTSSNGIAESQATKYSYEDMRLHIAGKGMLGFNSITSENLTLGTKVSTSITKWDEELWIPVETKENNSIGGESSSTISTYTVANVDKNYFAYISQKKATDLDGNMLTTVTNYDTSKGVITDQTVKNDGGENMYKKVCYSNYQNIAGVWLPSTLTMSQKHSDDATVFTTTTTYTYDDKGNVLTSIQNSGTPLAYQTTSTYDVYGNILSSVSTGSGIKPITKYIDYDPSGLLVVKKYTMPESAVNTYTYDLWGNVLTESDETEASNVITKKYTYDGWERKLTELDADGTLTKYEIGWGNSYDKQYFTQESTDCKPSITVWYDRKGHEVLRQTIGASNIDITKTTTYDKKGQVLRVENKTGKLTVSQTLSYDERGRVLTEVSSSGKSISYTYGNRCVTSQASGRSYTKTTDAWGNVVKAIDPVGEVEYVYSSAGKPSAVKTNGATVRMVYDAAGNKTSLIDPDAGTTLYTYAADGTLLTQTDGLGIKTTNSYDDFGRLSSAQIGQKTITYTYGNSGYEKMRLTRLAVDDNSIEYSYDKFGRTLTEKRNIHGNGTYCFSYAYNDKNQLAKTIYPGGLEVAYQYDNNGFNTQTSVGDNIIYKVENFNGLVSSTSFLGKLTATQTRDARGYVSNVKIERGSTVLENLEDTYDGETDNLLSRKRNGNLADIFGYDNLDRLVSVKTGSTETMKVSYETNGNITFKTGVGGYTYDASTHPHAVTEVENVDGNIPSDALLTSFNDYGKIQHIEAADKNLQMDFEYGPDQERWYSALTKNGTDIRTTIYAGEYEKIIENGITREFYYLDGNAIVIRQDGVVKPYIAFTDNLGSILSVMDENGTKVFDASYDAWGKQTVVLNTIGLHRGYTGHEMLSEFDIINMNGRLYDPVLGRFFSPDNYVQAPDNSQNFNRYSYCLNNPLKYTDPSGDFWNLAIGAAIGGVFNWAAHGFQFNAKGLGYFATGAVAGAVGSGVASGVNVAMAGGNFWTGAAGLAEGVSSTGFIAGAATGASSGFAGGLISGAGNSWVDGGSFGEGLLAGLGSGGIGALTGGVIGGVLGGFEALDNGTNFWTGNANLDMTGAYSCKDCDPEGLVSKLKAKAENIKAKYVGKFEGQNVFESKMLGNINGDYSAVTIPERGIIAAKGVFTSGLDRGKAMMQHEFGHILQYRRVGAYAYWHIISPESLASATLTSSSSHGRFWTETWANYLSKGYFGRGWLGDLWGYPAANISSFNMFRLNAAKLYEMMNTRPRGFF